MWNARETERVAFVFPGIGAPLCGAEAEFVARHRAVMAPYLAEASDRAGADLADALARQTVHTLDHRARELFVHAFNCGAYAVCEGMGLRPAYVAGYSFGIYSALAVTGALRYSDGLALADRARQLATEDCAGHRCGMAAIVGLGEAEVRAILQRPDCASLCLANVNSDTSVILSGLCAELEIALAEALARDALKAVMLDTDIPFHNPRFLAPAAERFRAGLGACDWRPAACPVISSINQSLLTAPQELLDLTARNLCTPIHWRRIVERMAALGITQAIECGPGVSLTRSAQFIDGAPPHTNVKIAMRRRGP